MSLLRICENCRFYYHKDSYIIVDLFGKERRKRGFTLCKWTGEGLKRKQPGCQLWKEKGTLHAQCSP